MTAKRLTAKRKAIRDRVAKVMAAHEELARKHSETLKRLAREALNIQKACRHEATTEERRWIDCDGPGGFYADVTTCDDCEKQLSVKEV